MTNIFTVAHTNLSSRKITHLKRFFAIFLSQGTIEKRYVLEYLTKK